MTDGETMSSRAVRWWKATWAVRAYFFGYGLGSFIADIVGWLR